MATWADSHSHDWSLLYVDGAGYKHYECPCGASKVEKG